MNFGDGLDLLKGALNDLGLLRQSLRPERDNSSRTRAHRRRRRVKRRQGKPLRRVRMVRGQNLRTGARQR